MCQSANDAGLRDGAISSASQLVFIVTTAPASRASQFSAGIRRCAEASMTTQSTSLTSSQTKNRATAAPALVATPNLRKAPRAKMAAGNTTLKAPHAADRPAWRLVSAQAHSAVSPPATTCHAITLHTETCGWRLRHAQACCAVRGLKGGSPSPDSVSRGSESM